MTGKCQNKENFLSIYSAYNFASLQEFFYEANFKVKHIECLNKVQKKNKYFLQCLVIKI